MSNPNPVEQLKNEYKEIEEFLISQGQPSLSSHINQHFRKILVLSAASYFEHKITDLLADFVKTKSGDERIVNFLLEGAIKQKYHTLFDWGEKDKPQNHKLFSFFGYAKKKEIIEEIRKNNELSETMKAFIEIGESRNILVHNNLAEYQYEQKTTDEIFVLFQTAEPFLEYLQEKLK